MCLLIPHGERISYDFGLPPETLLVSLFYFINFYLFLGYFSYMRDINGLQDSEICQPLWVTEFMVATFPELFLFYDDENDEDYYSYIYPSRTDGVIDYFTDCLIRNFLQWADYDTIRLTTEFLAAMDYLQRHENLPVGHLETVRNLVSFLFSELFVFVWLGHLVL